VGRNDGRKHCAWAVSLVLVGVMIHSPFSARADEVFLLQKYVSMVLIIIAAGFGVAFVLGTLLSTVLELVALVSGVRRQRAGGDDAKGDDSGGGRRGSSGLWRWRWRGLRLLLSREMSAPAAVQSSADGGSGVPAEAVTRDRESLVGRRGKRRSSDLELQCLALAISLVLMAVLIYDPFSGWREYVSRILVVVAAGFCAVFAVGTVVSTVWEASAVASRMRRGWHAGNKGAGQDDGEE